jgi:hypothetical protein
MVKDSSNINVRNFAGEQRNLSDNPDIVTFRQSEASSSIERGGGRHCPALAERGPSSFPIQCSSISSQAEPGVWSNEICYGSAALRMSRPTNDECAMSNASKGMERNVRILFKKHCTISM